MACPYGQKRDEQGYPVLPLGCSERPRGTATQSLQPDHHFLDEVVDPFADGFSGKYDSAVADSCNEVTRSANSLTEGVGYDWQRPPA